jgi:two-component sensor histidine kinase
MEKLVLGVLALKRPRAWVRYTATTLFVLFASLVRHSLSQPLYQYPFLLFFPAVFAAALLFGQAAGLYATVLSAALVLWFFLEPLGSLSVTDPAETLALVLFISTCVTTTLITEALRTAFARLAEAEHEKDLLLREVNHRIRNDLAMVSSFLFLGRRRAGSPEERSRFEDVAARVEVMGRVYHSLVLREGHAVADAGELLQELGERFRSAHFGLRPVTFEVRAEAAVLSLRQAMTVALIANELVTNALKHAFPDDRSGRIRITFRCEGDRHLLVVADDGVGMRAQQSTGGGLGRTLTTQLARQLGGELMVESKDGVRVTVAFPAGNAGLRSGGSTDEAV